MELENISKIRRLAVAAVVANITVMLLAAAALPRELMVVLPVAALILPLLTTAYVERVAERWFGKALPS
jgi:hypothetical protein